MIELTLTNAQARKVLQALNGPSVTDQSIADIYEYLERQLQEADAANAHKAPWRKVVSKERKGTHWFEILECGHRRMLRSSKNWQEDFGSRRRCEQCAK